MYTKPGTIKNLIYRVWRFFFLARKNRPSANAGISAFLLFLGCICCFSESFAAVENTEFTLGSNPSFSESDILGHYYFKGPRLLEIRKEGDNIVSELFGESEVFSQKNDSQGTGIPRLKHKGRLIHPTQIEFADFLFTADNCIKYFSDNAEEASNLFDDELSQFKKRFPETSTQRYFERCTLLSRGRLQIEYALPITILQFGEHSSEQIENADKVKAILNGTGTLGEYQMICGWKITDTREEEAWQALENAQYVDAANLFHLTAEADITRPFPCFGEASARIGTKEFDLARAALTAGFDRLDDETRPFFEQYAFLLKDQINSY